MNTEKIINPNIEKPYSFLDYCPYGALVEEFPLYTLELKYAKDHGYYSKLVSGKGWIECKMEDPNASPGINKVITEMKERIIEDPYSCEIFRHDCPAHYLAEFFEDIGKAIDKSKEESKPEEFERQLESIEKFLAQLIERGELPKKWGDLIHYPAELWEKPDKYTYDGLVKDIKELIEDYKKILRGVKQID